ncbi:MAG: P-II family nitrogen regulator [Desulfovibrio sp.]|jgi:nitrogen regulatory protein PII|nr:P-II family nitrogen regulator [Desulfovibrio sp.]
MDKVVVPGKLLISILNRKWAEEYIAITKTAGARGGTIAYGRTTGGNSFLQILSLADVDQEIVFTLIEGSAQDIVRKIVEKTALNPKKFRGFALLLPVSHMFVHTRSQDPRTTTDKGGAPMESGTTLITLIVNAGFADDVMAAARRAGATGGTILNARGTGTAEDVKFFGITLVPEKEMLLIVAAKDKVDPILQAVNATPRLCEPGGGIAFAMDVERFIVLGNVRKPQG